MAAEKVQPRIICVIVQLTGGAGVRTDSHIWEEWKTRLRCGVEVERIGLMWVVRACVVCRARPVPHGRRVIRHA